MNLKDFKQIKVKVYIKIEMIKIKKIIWYLNNNQIILYILKMIKNLMNNNYSNNNHIKNSKQIILNIQEITIYHFNLIIKSIIQIVLMKIIRVLVEKKNKID